MRVLLLTQYYPPATQVGGLRAAKVAEAIRAAGHEVVVLTARLARETGAVRQCHPGLEVRTLRVIPNPRHWYLALRDRIRALKGRGPGSLDLKAGGWTAPAQVPSWKRYLFSLLWLPDDTQGFIPAAVWAGLAESRRGLDLIYSTAPPFSVHLAALVLERLTRVPWVAEFRDPWTDSRMKPWFAQSRLSRNLEHWLERKCLEHADRVVAVSAGISRLLAAKLGPGGATRVVLARNGIESLQPARARTRSPGAFRIVHVGTFYHRRDPTPFLTALASLRRRGLIPPEGLRVELVGECRTYAGRSVHAAAAELGIADLLTFRDWIPKEAAQALIDDADLLLLLAQDQPDQVPNKLYDYLGTRRPILAFVDEDGESASMLREIGGHYLVYSDDPAEAERALADALAGSRSGGPTSPSDAKLDEWTTERQMRLLLASIGLPQHPSAAAPVAPAGAER